MLIVDDDERNAFAAVQALEDLGHELVVAHSGKDALRELLAGDFAVILLDLHMPEMDGYETARFIGGHPRTKHIPIVFVTAVASPILLLALMLKMPPLMLVAPV